ncbi:alpha/beta fold hydrolase [Pseudonocardia sp. D17]|uniref:alpha/beta fold hydrolase n=1 Tax=Pseudonocardia sp. D17 TaxID=882661 RepID=UPI002B3EB0F1|nr:3-oxoadipate enol-lactonase [Pseudonocardia sp. D17]
MDVADPRTERTRLDAPGGAVAAWTTAADHDAPPLVLLHSLGLDGRVFAPVVRVLATRRRCLALDLPGHGGTGADHGFDLTDAAARVAAVVSSQARPVDLLGVSLGGVVAQLVATRVPAAVRRLVLAHTFAYLPTGDARLADQRRRVAALPDPAVWAASRADAVLSPDAPRECRDLFVAAATAMDPARFVEAAAAVYTVDLRADAARIERPTLVVAGRHDDRVPAAATDALAALLPDARVTTVDGGHLSHLDRPGEFAATVATFLDQECRA